MKIWRFSKTQVSNDQTSAAPTSLPCVANCVHVLLEKSSNKYIKKEIIIIFDQPHPKFHFAPKWQLQEGKNVIIFETSLLNSYDIVSSQSICECWNLEPSKISCCFLFYLVSHSEMTKVIRVLSIKLNMQGRFCLKVVLKF